MREQDIFFIKKTFSLARKTEGFVSPNPLVGAVIVKNNRIISSGFHKKAGLPHAEIEAIKKAKTSLKGATLYVNLEPCFHWGKTPPCVDEIIKSGIKRVVVATQDPNPKVNGRSIKKLRQHNIEVEVGVLKEEAQRLNEIFFKNMKKKLPFVVAKVAQTLDGKIATKKGESKWITTKLSRIYARKLRDKYDAVCVGINTIILDNPSLEGIRKSPYKIIIDPQLKIPLEAKIIKKAKNNLIIFCQKEILKKKQKISHLKKKAKLFILNSYEFNLKNIIKILYREENICSIFVEGGSYTLGKFFDEKLVDKIYFFYAPKIMGGKTLTSIGGEGVGTLKKIIQVKDLKITRLNRDFLISGYIKQ